MRLKTTSIASVLFGLLILFSCKDDELTPREKEIAKIRKFAKTTDSDQVKIGDVLLTGSWQVTGVKYSYWDGDTKKEAELDYSQLPTDCDGYEEFWIIGKEDVMFAFKGSCFDKDWDVYSEVFDQTNDLSSQVVSIHYIYDEGDKDYTLDWAVTSLSGSELVLTDDRPGDEYFYQYTFKRESF